MAVEYWLLTEEKLRRVLIHGVWVIIRHRLMIEIPDRTAPEEVAHLIELEPSAIRIVDKGD
jgi:hypothetical protein